MADNDGGILAEFEEFLNAKKAQEQESANADDYEVEVWDEKGRGARVRRSHAKPFLQSLGIDLDAEPPGEGGSESGDNGSDKSKSKSSRNATGRQSTSVASGGAARKYFVKPTPGK